MTESDHSVTQEEEIETALTIENIITFGRDHKFQYKGFNYKLWRTPIQFFDSLEKIVKQHPHLEFLIKELKEIMEDWMNTLDTQAFPTDCPYMSSWENLLPIISNRPSYTISFPSGQIPASLEKMALKQETQKTKELSVMNKQNTGCGTSEKNSKKRKVKI
jgi:hypothetical protein